MTIKFVIENSNLYLLYSPRDSNSWVLKKFKEKENIRIRKTFYFKEEDFKNSNSDFDEYEELKFLLGGKNDNYFSINRSVLNTKQDVLIDKSFLEAVNSIEKIFISNNNISIFSKIDELSNESIIVGGNKPEAIPLEVFSLLIDKFPTTTELKHYQHSRITNILQEYFTSMTDGEKKLQGFFERRAKRLEKSPLVKSKTISIPKELYDYEIQKYESIQKIINDELLKPESKGYTETDWQNIIVDILPLIFPQYVAVLKEVQIKERYSKSTNSTKRSIDFILVNANGYIDILEIKRPCESCILLHSQYRDNYIPKRELSGAIMQTEKYIYYLNSLSKKQEEELTKKYQEEGLLPHSLSLKIRNPKGLILLGRSNNFNEQQQTDFEFIKRKYLNITDIFTYDDLLNRIENIIDSFKKKKTP